MPAEAGSLQADPGAVPEATAGTSVLTGADRTVPQTGVHRHDPQDAVVQVGDLIDEGLAVAATATEDDALDRLRRIHTPLCFLIPATPVTNTHEDTGGSADIYGRLTTDSGQLGGDTLSLAYLHRDHRRVQIHMDDPIRNSPHSARRLDGKLTNILQGRYTAEDFVIADAKDADMAFGLTAAGPRPGVAQGTTGPGCYPSRDTYLEAMRALIAQGHLDVILTSASNGERLAAERNLGDEITLAVRANDSTDVWNHRNGRYPMAPSRPFRTVELAAIRPFCDLVLYSVTFNDDLDHDLATLEAYKIFRREAADLGIRHFLEIFNPNACHLSRGEVGAFVNDSIVRCLAGVTHAHRPVFLKVAYNGAGALAELVEHDQSMVVGILGGSAGTARDTFELLRRVETNGGRVALFGRRIQRAESQQDLVGQMRPVLKGEVSPAEAVRAYHDALREGGRRPQRTLEEDLQITDPTLLAE